MLKIHRNVRTVGTVHRNVGTDQFLGFPWLFNTYLPYRERSRRSLPSAMGSGGSMPFLGYYVSLLYVDTHNLHNLHYHFRVTLNQ